MDLKNYILQNNAQKQINKLAKKYKNKKIVIYGAGEYFQLISKLCDLTPLNIVGISDLKFESDKSSNLFPYSPLAPEELKTFNFDILIIALRNDYNIMKILDKNIFNKNKKVKIVPIIYPTWSYLIKLYFGK